MIIGEECIWPGYKQDDAVLKQLISGDRMPIERKGMEIYEVDNFSRLIMIGNAERQVPATGDERRYFCLDVASDHREDHAYFEAMLRQLDESNGKGYKALMHYLQSMEITINLRKVPQTEVLKDQMLLNLEPVPKFMLKILAEVLLESTIGLKVQDYPKKTFTNYSSEFTKIISLLMIHASLCILKRFFRGSKMNVVNFRI